MTDQFTQVLKDIQVETAKLLLARIKDGTATAADLSVARNILKDNGIQAKPVEGSPLGNLASSIPTFDTDRITFN